MGCGLWNLSVSGFGFRQDLHADEDDGARRDAHVGQSHVGDGERERLVRRDGLALLDREHERLGRAVLRPCGEEYGTCFAVQGLGLSVQH